MDDHVSRSEFDTLVRKVDENTEMTKQVRDIVATFHVLYVVAKWIAAIGAAYVAIKTGAKNLLP